MAVVCGECIGVVTAVETMVMGLAMSHPTAVTLVSEMNHGM